MRNQEIAFSVAALLASAGTACAGDTGRSLSISMWTFALRGDEQPLPDFNWALADAKWIAAGIPLATDHYSIFSSNTPDLAGCFDLDETSVGGFPATADECNGSVLVPGIARASSYVEVRASSFVDGDFDPLPFGFTAVQTISVGEVAMIADWASPIFYAFSLYSACAMSQAVIDVEDYVDWVIAVQVTIDGGSGSPFRRGVLTTQSQYGAGPIGVATFRLFSKNGGVWVPGVGTLPTGSPDIVNFGIDGGDHLEMDVSLVSDVGYDFNDDGRFTQADVDILESLISEEPAFDPVHNAWDLDLDGVVDEAEVDHLQHLIDIGAGAGVFGDMDGDGVVVCSDDAALIVALDFNVDFDEVDYRLELDKNLDGHVSEAEWREAMRLCLLADLTEVGGTEEEPGRPDGQLTNDDVLLFVNLYNGEVGCPGSAPCNAADVTGIGGPPEPPDGQLTYDDIDAFVNSYNAGCE